MQFNQPCFGTSFVNGTPFFPFSTAFQTQSVQFPEVVGEGEVASLVLPDGSVQLYFLPTNKCCTACFSIPNKSTCWFIKRVTNPVPHPVYCQNQLPGGIPYPRLTLGCSGSFEVPNPYNPVSPPSFKFHSDGTTSTTDIHYFYPRSSKYRNPNKSCTGVQVVVAAQSSSCQSDVVSCVPSNRGQQNCNYCSRKCENNGAFKSCREICYQGDTKSLKRDVICKCYPEPNLQRSSQSQVKCKCYPEPKVKRSAHSQTSMSIDESRSEIKLSRCKKQKHDRRRKKNERKSTKRKQSSSREYSGTCIRNRKRQRKNNTRKRKKMNRASNTDCVSCICSDTSMSSSKSPKKHFPLEQYFDSAPCKFKYSNSISSELDCHFCESCLSSLEQKKKKRHKNKSSEKVLCKCYLKSDVSLSMSQTDSSNGMSVDQEIKGHRKTHPKSNDKKKKQENKAMIVEQEIKHHGTLQENKKQSDNTSVTCLCLYPSSDESSKSVSQKQLPDKKSQNNSNKLLHPQNKNTSNHSNPFSSLDKISPSRFKSSNPGPKYKADADFCECFSNLVQPASKDKSIRQIEKDLKRIEKTNNKDKSRSTFMRSDALENPLIRKNETPTDTQNRDINLIPEVKCDSTLVVHTRETAKQQCDKYPEFCECDSPVRTQSNKMFLSDTSYLSQSSIGETKISRRDETKPSLMLPRYTLAIPKSNSSKL